MARPPHRPWKEDLKDLFAMHRGERRAFTVLFALCLVGAAWVTWEQWLRPVTLPDKEQLQVVWGELHAKQEQDPGARPGPKEMFQAPLLFAFDPNETTADQWRQLGLSPKQAAAILRYIERGGSFRTKAELARMRVVDPGLFARWEPFIQLPDAPIREGYKPFQDNRHREWDTAHWKRTEGRVFAERPTGTAHPLELNTADSAALVALRGIGPSFARGILRYRDRLGGFVSLDQLGEVYVLRDKPDAVEHLKQLLVIDPDAVAKIPINTCTVEDLGPHPYAGWKLARALVAYRQQHGPFRDVQAIGGCALVTDSIRARLAPYLTVE